VGLANPGTPPPPPPPPTRTAFLICLVFPFRKAVHRLSKLPWGSLRGRAPDPPPPPPGSGRPWFLFPDPVHTLGEGGYRHTESGDTRGGPTTHPKTGKKFDLFFHCPRAQDPPATGPLRGGVYLICRRGPQNEVGRNEASRLVGSVCQLRAGHFSHRPHTGWW
jgi:hypothetical protein